jgi:hypothetical protein
VHLGPRVGFRGLMTNNYISNLVLRVYDIQKGNTDDEINFYMGINDKKRKKSRRLRRIENFIYFLSYRSSILSRGYIG